jgi:O-antigen/teichoic acid export membrane protein
MKSLRQQFIKGIIWSAIQNWGTQGISFLVFLLLARLLKPEAFGLVSLAEVFLAFVRIFLDQGFSAAIVQRKELEPEHLNTAFWINLGISLLLTLFGIAFADTVATFFKQPELIPIIRWMSLSFFLSAFSQIQSAILQRKFRFKALATRCLIGAFIGGIVGIAMAFFGYGVWSLVGQQLSNQIGDQVSRFL